MDIKKVHDLLEKKGNLHDCIVVEINFCDGVFSLKIDDINKNYAGLKGYSGPQPAIIRCICDKYHNIEMNLLSGINAGWISDCTIKIIDTDSLIDCYFTNGGHIRIYCTEIEIFNYGARCKNP